MVSVDAEMTESDAVRGKGYEEILVYGFKMDQRADAAPLSASIFDSSLRSAPYVLACVRQARFVRLTCQGHSAGCVRRTFT